MNVLAIRKGTEKVFKGRVPLVDAAEWLLGVIDAGYSLEKLDNRQIWRVLRDDGFFLGVIIEI